MIRGMHHISLATGDLDRFVAFYRDLLGMTLDRISPIPSGWAPFENIVGLRNVAGQVAQFNLGKHEHGSVLLCRAQAATG